MSQLCAILQTLLEVKYYMVLDYKMYHLLMLFLFLTFIYILYDLEKRFFHAAQYGNIPELKRVCKRIFDYACIKEMELLSCTSLYRHCLMVSM